MSLPSDRDPLANDIIPAEGADPAGTEGARRPLAAGPSWLRQLRGWRQAPEWLFKLVEQDKDALSALDLEGPLAETQLERPVDAGQAVPEQAGSSWLQDLGPIAEQTAPPGRESEATVVQPLEEPLPAWLTGAESAPQSAAEEQLSAVSPAEQETPDWLSTLRGEPEGQSEEGPPAIFAEEEEVPDWLSRLGDEAGGKSAEAPSAVPSEQEIPDWLSRLEQTAEEQPAAKQPTAEQPVAPAFAEGELPDWLTRPTRGLEPDLEVKPPAALGEGQESTAVQPRSEEELPTRAEEEPVAFADAEVPDWLQEFDPVSPLQGIAGEPQAVTDSEAFDWLDELGPPSERPVVEEPAVGPVAEDGAAEQPESIEGPPQQIAAAPAEAEVPAVAELEGESLEWLSDLEEPLPAPPEEISPAAPTEAEVPAELEGEPLEWLSDLEEPLPAPPEEMSPAVPAEEAALPDWLQGLEVPSAGQPVPRRSVTDWLRSVEETPAAEERRPSLPTVEPPSEPEPIAAAEPVAAEEPVATEPEEPVQAPEWLQESISAEEPAWPQETLEGEPHAAPSWLSEPGLTVEKAEAEVLPELSEGETLPAAEIPSWLEELRAQETPAEPEGVAEAQAVETSGPLLGLTGLLNPEPLLGIFPKSTYKPTPPVPDAHLAESRLLEQILAEPTARPAATLRKPGREVMHSLGRWIMYAALLVALIAAAFVPDLQGLVQTPNLPEAKDMYAVIDSLPAKSQVLLALDYDASLDGELTPQARVLLWHALRQGLEVATVSMTPQGIAIAQNLYESDAANVSDGGRYAWGEQFINLGYLPPHPASLQAFMSDPLEGASYGGIAAKPGPRAVASILQTPLAQRIRSFDDLDLIIVITGNQDHMRWWIEQVGSQHPVRIVAGVSAAIAPYLQPYYAEGGGGQLKGMLPGLAGAAAYEVLADAQFSPSARENLILQGYAQIVLVMVILLGGIRALFGIPRGKR